MMNPNFYTTQLVHNSNITLVLKLISYNFSVTPPKSVEIGEDGVLKFEDSDKLYAAVSINDPYHYSDSDFAIILRGKPHAIPIQIVAEKA